MRDVRINYFLTTTDFTGTHNGEEELPGGGGATAQSELQRVVFAAASTRNGGEFKVCFWCIHNSLLGANFFPIRPTFF